MTSMYNFVVKTAENYYSKNLSLDEHFKDAVEEFTYNAHVILLQAYVEGGNKLHLSTSVKNEKRETIIFFKTSSNVLNEGDTVCNVNIITLGGVPEESLYFVIKQIYSPFLSNNNDIISSNIHQNLAELASNLRFVNNKQSKNDNLNVILSIHDEVEYWRAITQGSDIHKKDEAAASGFVTLFEEIEGELRSLQSNSMSENREVAENIGGMLDDVWRVHEYPYHEQRMKHIFDVVGFEICTFIQKSICNERLWEVCGDAKDSELLLLLSDSLLVVGTWINGCKSLTETFWPNYALHSWTAKAYWPKMCQNFHDQLKEVLDVRSTHHQLNKLLTQNERIELSTDKIFQPFKGVNLWSCVTPNRAWQSAVAKFSANFKNAENLVAEKLKPRFHNTSTKQMLHEFIRYKALINRPVVKRALNNELELFVSSLTSLVKSVQSQIGQDVEAEDMYQPPELSPVVQQVQWAKQMEAKVKDIQECAENYLKEFEGSAELVRLSTEVAKELKNSYMQAFEDWCRDIQAQVKAGSLEVGGSQAVVSFNADTQLLEVRVWRGAARALSSARALAALALPPPPPLADKLAPLHQVLHYADQLTQVASFHNTLGSRMVPATRGLLLAGALELAALVREHRALAWRPLDRVAAYTARLKQAVLKLDAQNAYVTSQHIAIRNIVASLVDTDLLAKQAEWKRKVKEIRDIIETVEASGYKNTEAWRTHWDWQLYKALECQYVKTLQSLHKYFPRVSVDIVLRGRAARTAPGGEELRARHYAQLRRLVALPAHFLGIDTRLDQNNIFADIVHKHGHMGNKCISDIESTLARVDAVCEAWTRRAALACVPDLDQLCTEHLNEPADWELNFKACKAYGQAVAKMTFEDEKVEWITMVSTGLRREFEWQSRSLWSSLLGALQGSVSRDGAALLGFVAAARHTLHSPAAPANARELADLSAKQQALRDAMPEMEKLAESLREKSSMLRTWGGDAAAGAALRDWAALRETLAAHQEMFHHQAELVRSSLRGSWANLSGRLEAWWSRAEHGEPGDVTRRRAAAAAALQAWRQLATERDDILDECQKFGMELEITETWKDAEKFVAEEEKLWAPFTQFEEEFESLAKQEWLVFQKKLYQLDEFVSNWRGRLEPFTPVTLHLQQEIDKYTDLTPILKYLRGGDLTERHWREVCSVLDIATTSVDRLTLGELLEAAANIRKHAKTLQKISSSASSEAAVRGVVAELELWFAAARLRLAHTAHTAHIGAARPVAIGANIKETLAKVEEQQWAVSAAGAGAGAGGWEQRLRASHDLLRALHRAQTRWLYLEPILSGDEGELGMKFRKVDQGFRQVSRTLEADPRLSALLQAPRLQPTLDAMLDQLQACQAALNQYMEEKRSIFPRLFFLNDDDLLELLGQARAGAHGKVAVMQTHLKKLFPGMTGVKLGPDGQSITALCSQNDEVLNLEHSVDIDCPVEVWLKNLETEMRASLKKSILTCLQSNTMQEQDPFSLPTQILCLAQNIRFTEQAEKAIMYKDLHKLKTQIDKEYVFYTECEVVDDNERLKRQALVLQCAFYKNLVNIFIEKNVTETDHWLWIKQLRFYLRPDKEIVAKMGIAEMSYSYEYLGVNTGQFARTKLAEDSFLILTQAIHSKSVGNPFGPAGTGKTESVKALGGLLGRLVLVFNCDEAMDGPCLGRLLCGLASCGAWGCFDELNRLTTDTMSALAHHLTVLAGPTPAVNGKQVCVSPWFGVAATMNPRSREYGGRRAPPAALAALLRPVSVSQPEGRDLLAYLFTAKAVPDAHKLADDLATVFSLAGSLVCGRHYSWGGRALAWAGGAARGRREAAALLRAVLAAQLTHTHRRRFNEIVNMVFSDIEEDDITNNPMSAILEDSARSLNLVPNKMQIEKCLQLHDQLQQRMGVVMVGPPASGKTVVRQILKTALIKQGKNIVEYIISPKAMSRNFLLGQIDPDTRQWIDGVIPFTALEVSNQPPDVWSWIVCDGDVDPEWVEALNSVLDDNRLLTLPSGWRIQFPRNVNFLFETHSLDHASPATVSRMGIILFSEETECAMNVFEKWLEKVEIDNETVRSALPLLREVVKKCLDWTRRHQSELIMNIAGVSLVKQLVSQFEYAVSGEWRESGESGGGGPSAEDAVHAALQRAFIGHIHSKALPHFHDEMSGIIGAPPLPAVVGEWADDTLYMSPRLARCEAALRAVLDSKESNFILVGPEASAKNMLLEHVLRSINTVVITIDCTPVMEPEHIIEELKRSGVLGGGGGGGGGGARDVTLLVRGLGRARRDAWLTAPLHQALLQLVSARGCWSREAGALRRVTSRVTRVLCAAAAPLPPHAPRLARPFHVYLLPEPDEEELSEIVFKYLRLNVDRRVADNDIMSLANTMLEFYKNIIETFTKQTQYKWTASDLRKWCENVKWYCPTDTNELIQALSAEAKAIFRDRLVTESDKAKFSSYLRKYLKDTAMEDLYYSVKIKSGGVYLEAVEKEHWYADMEKIINQSLSEHEFGLIVEASYELSILYPAFAKACNGGSVVCVGRAGVGRDAAARLAATAAAARLYHAVHPQHLSNNIKNALTSAGVEGNRTLVLVGESAANRCTLGQLEALLGARTVHAIPQDMMPSLSHTQQPEQFLENLKHHLGIIICLDTSQRDLQELLTSYPMLYSDHHMIWMESWCEETLRQMPRQIIQRLSKEDVSESAKDDVDMIPVEGFVDIYKSIESRRMQAPCRYVKFVKTYYHIVKRKGETLKKTKDMLSSGVEALRRARSEVATLQKEASEQETALSEKRDAANQALEQISATVRAATDKKEEMQALKASIHEENERLQIRKKEIEAEMATVEPIIAAARAAVGEIRPEALTEIRSLRAPPDTVRDVLEGVLRLMGVADTSWHSMKAFLARRGVRDDIRNLDASQITEEAAASVEQLMSRRGASFSPAGAARASAACGPLAGWLRAQLACRGVARRLRPLQEQQARLLAGLRDAERQLAALELNLSSVDERVARLKEELGAHSRDAAAIELRAEAAQRTLRAAADLLGPLARESADWDTHLENVSKEIVELNVRSLLAAAYVIYLPEKTEPQAREYIAKWCSLLGFEDSNISIINFLASVEKQLEWEANGISADLTAMKNAVTIDQQCLRAGSGAGAGAALALDPAGEALGALRAALGGAALVSAADDALRSALHTATRLGRILIVTDVSEELPACLLALVLGGAEGGGGAGAGTGAGAWGGAGMVLHTRDATLPARLPPHLTDNLSVIHFTPRVDPLTDQLVYHALQQQNPEVNEKTRALKLEKATLQKQQYELQENLLKDLCSNTDILHDPNLLSSLNKTRASSEATKTALQAAVSLEADSRRACDALRHSARRAAILALSAAALAQRRPLVNLPVDTVLEVYVTALQRGMDKSGNIDNEAVIKYVTKKVIERVLLSLHKKDKYAVVLYLLKQIYEHEMPNELWQIFIDNTSLFEELDSISDVQADFPWLPKESVRKMAYLHTTSPKLYSTLKENVDTCKELFESQSSSSLSRLRLGAFAALTVTSILRPDDLHRASLTFIEQMLGGGGGWRGAAGAGAGAGAGAARWGGRAPLLLLGAAPPPTATDLCMSVEEDHEAILSVARAGAGAGQRGAGGALRLQLGAAPFTPALTRLLRALVHVMNENTNPEFRIWIICEEREIPPLIANACVNVVLEPPEDMKSTVLSTLRACRGSEGDAGGGGGDAGGGGGDAGGARHHPLEIRFRVALALLHAVLLGRRDYIPIGWSCSYSWSWGEAAWGARLGALAARGAGGAGGAAGWAAARALAGALYGGRVSARGDARTLLAALHAALPAAARAAHWTPHALHAALPLYNTMDEYIAALSGASWRGAGGELDAGAGGGGGGGAGSGAAEALWLPASSGARRAAAAAERLRATLTELESTRQSKSDTGTDSLKPILALWKKLMAGNPLLKQQYIEEKEGWWGLFLSGEVSAATRAVRLVHADLARRSPARLSLTQVPERWQAAWGGPPALASYLRELAHRAARLVELAAAPNVGDFPQELEVRSVLSVSRASAALRAATAAASAAAAAAATPRLLWDPTPQDKQSRRGLVLVGLRLWGARWGASGAGAGHGGAGAGALYPLPAAQRDPDTPAPPILLYYTQSSEEESEEEFYIPVYDSAERSGLVLSARVALSPDWGRAAAGAGAGAGAGEGGGGAAGLAALHAVALYVPPVSD